MKIDDDELMNPFKVLKFLNEPKYLEAKKSFICRNMKGSEAIHDPDSKFKKMFVTYEEYPGKSYGSYW